MLNDLNISYLSLLLIKQKSLYPVSHDGSVLHNLGFYLFACVSLNLVECLPKYAIEFIDYCYFFKIWNNNFHYNGN